LAVAVHVLKILFLYFDLMFYPSQCVYILIYIVLTINLIGLIANWVFFQRYFPFPILVLSIHLFDVVSFTFMCV